MSDDDKARWQRCANADGGQPLASWIRSRLNRAAAIELGEVDNKPKGESSDASGLGNK